MAKPPGDVSDQRSFIDAVALPPGVTVQENVSCYCPSFHIAKQMKTKVFPTADSRISNIHWCIDTVVAG